MWPSSRTSIMAKRPLLTSCSASQARSAKTNALKSARWIRMTSKRNVALRFSPNARALNGTAAALEFSYVLASGEGLTLTAHAVYLPRPRIEIKGPKGVQASFDWQAALATSPARMCTVVLVNSIGSY